MVKKTVMYISFSIIYDFTCWFSYTVGLVSMLQIYGLDWAVSHPYKILNMHKSLSLSISVYVCFSCTVHHQSWLAHSWLRATYHREGICLFVLEAGRWFKLNNSTRLPCAVMSPTEQRHFCKTEHCTNQWTLPFRNSSNFKTSTSPYPCSK